MIQFHFNALNWFHVQFSFLWSYVCVSLNFPVLIVSIFMNDFFHCRHVSISVRFSLQAYVFRFCYFFNCAIQCIYVFYSLNSVCYSVLYKSVYSVLFIVFWCSFYWAFQFHVYISVSISLKGMCAYQFLKHLQDLHRYIQTIFSH